jgi:TRAP-type C4-dicarboxylate transport system permease small subunit
LKRFLAILARVERAARFLEDAVLVLILAAMILLAAGQILLRNLFDVGFFWSDELLRMLVLWIAVAGAVAASRANRHINIAVLDLYLPAQSAASVRVLIHAFTAAVCGAVAWVSLQFVLTSRAYGDVLLGGVPAWWLQAILPLGFVLMSWRYAVFLVTDIRRAIGKAAAG